MARIQRPCAPAREKGSSACWLFLFQAPRKAIRGGSRQDTRVEEGRGDVMKVSQAGSAAARRYRRQPRAAYLDVRGWSNADLVAMHDDLRVLLCWHDYATERAVQSATAALGLPLGRSIMSPAAEDGAGLGRGEDSMTGAGFSRAQAVELVDAFLAAPGEAALSALPATAPRWVRRLCHLMARLQGMIRSEDTRRAMGETRPVPRAPATALRGLRRVPAIAPGFIDGLGLVSADQVTAALLASMRAGREGWHGTDENLPVFPYVQGATGVPAAKMDVFMQPPDGTPLSGGLTATMWDMVGGLSDLDTDILNVLQAHILRYRDADGFAWITAQAILDDREMLPITKREGHDRRTAGHRTEDLAEIAACMARLQHMYVRISTMTYGRNQVAHLDSRVLDVDLHGSDERYPMAWHFTLPFLTRLFLQPPTNFEAIMLQPVLRYHRKNNRREKRIGDYCLRQFRLALTRQSAPLPPAAAHALRDIEGDRRPLVVVRVLRDIFSELSLFVDERNPERTRSQFEATMRDLVAKEIIGSWGYCDTQSLPPRRWLDRWLGQAIWFGSTERVREYYAHALPGDRKTRVEARALPSGADPPR